jgi:RNA polymerase sigma-70 factor (ECF subfamily)
VAERAAQGIAPRTLLLGPRGRTLAHRRAPALNVRAATADALAMAARIARSLLHLQTDARLCRLAAAGDGPAFEELVTRHRAALLRRCERVLRSDRAHDAVQQTFINAHRALIRGDRVEAVEPWLHRIAQNAALAILRERGFSDTPLELERDGATETVDDVVERREQLASVVGALGSIPERQREALVLQALEGQSHEQIAARMGTTDGAVRQLLARGRSALRAGLTTLIPFGLALRLGTRDAQAAVGSAGTAGAGAAVAKGLAIAAVTAGATGIAAGVVPPTRHAVTHPPRTVAATRGPISAPAAPTTAVAAPRVTAHAAGERRPRRHAVHRTAHRQRPATQATAGAPASPTALTPASTPASAPATPTPANHAPPQSGGAATHVSAQPATSDQPAPPAATATPVASPAPSAPDNAQGAGDAPAGDRQQGQAADAPSASSGDTGAEDAATSSDADAASGTDATGS